MKDTFDVIPKSQKKRLELPLGTVEPVSEGRMFGVAGEEPTIRTAKLLHARRGCIEDDT